MYEDKMGLTGEKEYRLSMSRNAKRELLHKQDNDTPCHLYISLLPLPSTHLTTHVISRVNYVTFRREPRYLGGHNLTSNLNHPTRLSVFFRCTLSTENLSSSIIVFVL